MQEDDRRAAATLEIVKPRTLHGDERAARRMAALSPARLPAITPDQRAKRADAEHRRERDQGCRSGFAAGHARNSAGERACLSTSDGALRSRPGGPDRD